MGPRDEDASPTLLLGVLSMKFFWRLLSCTLPLFASPWPPHLEMRACNLPAFALPSLPQTQHPSPLLHLPLILLWNPQRGLGLTRLGPGLASGLALHPHGDLELSE